MKSAPRFSPPKLKDPRVIVGLILVVGSLVATWAIVSNVAQTITVWAATRPLVSGGTIAQDALAPVEVRLPDASQKYLSTQESSPVGMTVAHAVAEGELIPAKAVVDPSALTGRVIALEIPDSLPQAVRAGALIDVWATDTTSEDARPERVLERITVNAVDKDASGFTSTSNTRLEIFVENDRLDRVLEVVAGEYRISVVAYPGS